MLLINHRPIMVDALNDYKKYFNNNSEQIKHINQVLKHIEKPEFFPITYINKDDIVHAFNSDVRIKLKVKKMNEADMKSLASDLSNDYCEQLFWDSLRVIFELKFIKGDT